MILKLKSFLKTWTRPLKGLGLIGVGFIIGKIHSVRTVITTLESYDVTYSTPCVIVPNIKTEIEKFFNKQKEKERQKKEDEIEDKYFVTDLISILTKQEDMDLEHRLRNYLLPHLKLKKDSIFAKFNMDEGFILFRNDFYDYVIMNEKIFNSAGFPKRMIAEYEMLAYSLMVTNSKIMTRWIYEHAGYIKKLEKTSQPIELQKYEIALKEYLEYWRKNDRRVVD